MHEETVHRAATVDAEYADRLACGAHGFDEIARLVRDALERRAGEMRARRRALDPDQQSARVHVPMRRSQAGERRDEVHVVVSRETRRERLGLGGRRDDAETIAQPLHRRARDERASLERVANALADVPCDRGEKAAARRRWAIRGIHQKEAARPVGVLRLARCEAGLTEERGLLVPGDSGDRNDRAEVPRVGLGDDSTRAHRARHHRAWDVEEREKIVVPDTAVNVEHERPRCVREVGRVRASPGQVPDQPRVDGSAHELA